MSGVKILLNKLINRTTIYWLFGIIVFAHLLVFIQYPFADGSSYFTNLGERMKSVVPYLLLITLLPAIHNRLDKINIKVVNGVSLAFIGLCIIYQITGVSGQAWSTVAFSGILVLVLFNNIRSSHKISQTIAFVFSFMVVWLGWVIFEVLFQAGTWFYYPILYDGLFTNFLKVIVKLIEWLIPALLFIGATMYEKKTIMPRIKLGNIRYFAILIGVGIIATVIWFYNGMLIPLPVGNDGVMYATEINYFTQNHLWFSISRLSQTSIMLALPVLFLRKGNSK